MNIAMVIISIIIGVICAFIHKSKGYSPITGFLWGFFFTIIGLIVMLLEKSKEEKELLEKDTGKKGLSLGKWLAIFLGIGIILIIIFFVVNSIM